MEAIAGYDTWKIDIPKPKIIGFCDWCKDDVADGFDMWDMHGETACECCIDNMSREEILENLGFSKILPN